MKLRSVWLCCALAVAGGTAHAALPADIAKADVRPGLARELVELTTPLANFRQGGRQAIVALYKAQAAQAGPAEPAARSPPEARAAENAAAEAEIDRFVNATAPALMDRSAELYAGEMSAEQLRMALDFYQTDAGRKLLMLVMEDGGDQARFVNRLAMDLSPAERAEVEAFGRSETGRLLAQVGDEANRLLTAAFRQALADEMPVILRKSGEAAQGYAHDHPLDAPESRIIPRSF
jgi:hypothetical protein